MKITEDVLFKAILAMDSYNRGKVGNLNLLGSKIGNAILLDNSDDTKQTFASFFAQTYKDTKGTSDLSDDQIIISYRGTDAPLDVVTGWTVGGGIYNYSQAILAAEFYKAVIGNESPYLANVSFTGHSLGGGLAGLMASLYSKEAVIFDNMPFELAASNIYDASVPDSLSEALIKTALATFFPSYSLFNPNEPFDQTVKDTYYFNGINPQIPNSDNIDAYAVTGEILASTRGRQNTPVTYIDSNASFQYPVDLHSQALLVSLLFAQKEFEAGNITNDWADAGPDFINTLFTDEIAKASGSTDSGVMLSKIAYSAINNGELIFGDTAIHAMFNDANDLGKALNDPSLVDQLLGALAVSDVLEDKADSISKVFVQYASHLANNKKTEDSVLDGVLKISNDEKYLTVNFAESDWSDAGTALANTNVVGRNELFNEAFPASARVEFSSEAISQYIFGTRDGGTFTVSDAAPAGKLNVIYGSDGEDDITGSSGDDYFFGGGDDDILKGESGNDVFNGGLGGGVINGGSGTDTIIFSYLLNGVEVNLSDETANVKRLLIDDKYELFDIENVTGGLGTDHIVGDDKNNIIDGWSANDELEGGLGSDTYKFSEVYGNDTIIGGAGDIDRNDVIEINNTVFSGSVKNISGNNYELLGKTIQIISGDIGTDATIKIIDGFNSILVEGFTTGDYGINFLDITTLRPERDFYTGTTSDGLLFLNWFREGDLSYSIDVLNDGTVLRPAGAGFQDAVLTIPANLNFVQSGGVDLRGLRGSQEDVLVEVKYSVSPANSPIVDLVTFTTDTVRYLFIGDRVDNRGGQAFGDPHLITFDNVSYDFQAAGDFILTRATSGPDYEVQARFSAFSSAVSVTTAMATKVDGIAVSIQIDGDTGDLLIDGSSVNITDGNSIAVGGGSISRNGRKIEIDHGNGDKTSVDVFSSFMNVTPSPSLARIPGSLEGLLGDADGNPGDDFQLADGTVLSTPLPISTLYGSYAASWLVADSESILPGARELFDAPDRIITIDSLPQSLRQAAEAAVAAAGITNPILREAAILDFALTGNVEFIEAAKLTNDIFDPIIDTVAVDPINNPVVILTANQIELDEANPAHQTATLTVSRGSTTGDLTINYNVIGVGAYPANTDDFSGNTSGTVVINDGEDTATFTVGIVDDLLDEESEQFDVAIALDGTQASAYELLVSSVRMTILDDDDGPVLNEVIGTTASDYLVGTGNADIIRSLGGSYDRSSGGLGADIFAFGSEALNGIRERDVIMDYEVGIDSILLEDGATVGSVRQTSTGAVIFLEGDLDAIYVQGEGVLPGNLTFLPESLLLA